MINIDWTNFKLFIQQRSLSVQFIETINGYYLFALDGNMTITCLLDKLAVDQTDLLDFETNYKSLGNQKLGISGRTGMMFSAIGVAAGSTGVETAITLSKAASNGATSNAVSFAITNGKKFRIQNIIVATRGNATATAQTTTFKFRINTAGAVITTSTPVVFSVRSATAAVASAWDRCSIEIPEGFEITGTANLQFGITANSVYVTNAPTWDVLIIGYEY